MTLKVPHTVDKLMTRTLQQLKKTWISKNEARFTSINNNEIRFSKISRRMLNSFEGIR